MRFGSLGFTPSGCRRALDTHEKRGDSMRLDIAAAALAVLLAAGGALADNDVGCGLGTEVWKGQQGLGPKLLASFTNGVTFQSVSITFGLVNCNGRNTVTADAELRRFASQQLDRIARELATGGGESVEALAFLLGVPVEQRAAFAELGQRRFAELFPGAHPSAGDLLDGLERLMAEDHQLAAVAPRS